MTRRARAVLIAGCAALVAAGSPAPAPLQPYAPLLHGRVGSLDYVSYMQPADVDGDGVPEFIGLQHWINGVHWFAVDRPPGGYAMVRVGDAVAGGSALLRAFDFDGDLAASIVLGAIDGRVHIHDAASPTATRILATPHGAVKGLAFGDADNDGAPDLVVSGASGTALYDPLTGAFVRSIAPGGGEIEVADVDLDPAQEIILADGRVLELNGAVLTTQWTNPAGAFGARIRVADLDGDGRREIIGADAWYEIRAYDADTQTEKWAAATTQDIAAFCVADVDASPGPEIVYGDGQGDDFHTLAGPTGAPLLTFSTGLHPGGYARAAAFGDFDADGSLEVAWTSPWQLEGRVEIRSYPAFAVEGSVGGLLGPLLAADVGDADGDGDLDLVVCGRHEIATNVGPRVFVMDPATHAVLASARLDSVGNDAVHGVRDLRVGDLDGDGAPEIVLAGDSSYSAALYVLDGATLALEEKRVYDAGLSFCALELRDMDGDGALEIVAGTDHVTTAADGARILVLDGASGALEWGSPATSDPWTIMETVRAADVDGDGVPDIVALVEDRVVVVDGATKAMTTLFTPCSAVDAGDVDGNGRDEILVAGTNGLVFAMDGLLGIPIAQAQLGAGRIRGLHGRDLNGDGVRELLLVREGLLEVRNWAGHALHSTSIALDSPLNPLVRLRDPGLPGPPRVLIAATGAVSDILLPAGPGSSDVDEDGLPDAWEELHFGVGRLDLKPADDPDLDGLSNAAEFAGGSDPADPDSPTPVPPPDPPSPPAPAPIPPAPLAGDSGSSCGLLGLELLVVLAGVALAARRA